MHRMPTPRYRAVSATSHVDETLFGEPLAKTFRNSRRIVTGPVAASDVVVSENELTRIKSGQLSALTRKYRPTKMCCSHQS